MNKIHESAEDYLEMILILQRKKSCVHAIDIVRELNYSKPSVSIAMKNLRNEGLVLVNESNEITLTDKGREIAERIYERHIFIGEGLMSMGVDETTAFAEACKIEHVISQDTFEKMKKAAKQLKKAAKTSK